MRRNYLDNIRWVTVVLVVIYHVIYMYNGIIAGGVAGPLGASKVQYQDAIQYILYPWFMVLLFLVSGMSARYALNKQTGREFIKARTIKLLVPSTIGLFVFQWIQGYANMALSDAFSNIPDAVPAPALYLIMVVSGTGVLWYIQVLWVLSVLLVLIRKFEKDRIHRLCEKTNIVILLLLGVLIWAAAQVLNTPVIVVYRFGIYGAGFLVGYFVLSHDKVTEKIEKYSIPLLAAAVILAAAYVYVYFGENYAEEPAVNSPLACAYGWIACLAVIGCMKRWGDASNSFTKWMSGKSFGLYVFHYLAISAAALLLKNYGKITGAPAYILTTVAAFAGGYALYEVISRIPFFRWAVLGISKKNGKGKQNV